MEGVGDRSMCGGEGHTKHLSRCFVPHLLLMSWKLCCYVAALTGGSSYWRDEEEERELD